MKAELFAVFSALAAVTIAAPQHHQISFNKAAQSPATTFKDYCYNECWHAMQRCPPPWYANNKGTLEHPCWTCCYPAVDDAIDPSTTGKSGNDETDINIDITISDTSVANSGFSLFEDPCEGYSTNKGTASHPCWTCCEAPEDTAENPSISSTPDKEEIEINIKISDTTLAASASFIFEEYCWKICGPPDIQCPEKSYPKKVGSCWTCCQALGQRDASITLSIDDHAPSEDNIEVDTQISDLTPAISGASIFWDYCLRNICHKQEPKCREHWHTKKIGECWACCLSFKDDDDAPRRRGEDVTDSVSDKEEITVDVQIVDTTAASSASLIMDYPKKFGHCWACCRSPGKDDVSFIDSAAAIWHPLGLPEDL
ncbi:hypothetical protein VF21_05565 [Pseudogymnoascus sp. 05NY08]|nr:hypothetical protein VF21_05565 [Pseudogymnoascus sp. 05NY08]